jgi:hypothetical protein
MWFRRKTAPPSLSRAHSLASKIVRNRSVIEETRDNGRLVLILSLKPARWTRLIGQSPDIPVLRRFELDDLGRYVWEKSATSPTVEQLIRRFAADQQVNVREAEVSITSFIRMLMKRGLVGVVAPDTAL